MRDATVALEPRAMALLRCLLEAKGALVEQDDLLDAVWHTRAVSESVVARAIMKVRRALDDQNPRARLIQTVAKKGYRIAAHVTTLSVDPTHAEVPRGLFSVPGSAFSFAVMSFSVEPDTPTAWDGAGMAGLLFKLLGDAPDCPCAPMQDVGLLRARSAPGKDLFRDHCDTLGAACAVTATLKRRGSSLALCASWGSHLGDVVSETFVGGEPNHLVRKLATRLLKLGSSFDDSFARSDATDWTIAQAFSAAWQGDFDSAVRIAQSAIQWRGSEQLSVAQWMLTRNAADALAWCDAWLLQNGPNPECDPSVIQAHRAGMRLTKALALSSLGDNSEAARVLQALVDTEPGTAVATAVRIAALQALAQCLRMLGHHPAAIEAIDRCVGMAVGSGSPLLEARARIQHTKILVLLQVNARQVDAASRASSVVARCQIPALEQEMAGLAVMALLRQRRYADAHNMATRFAALASSANDPDALALAHGLEFLALVRGHRTDEALSHRMATGDIKDFVLGRRPMILSERTILHWQCGDIDAAISTALEAQGLPAALGNWHLLTSHCNLCMLHAWQKNTQAAQHALACIGQTEGIDQKGATLTLAQANVYLCQGNRQHALEALEAQHSRERERSHDAIDLALSLGWLYIESNVPGTIEALNVIGGDFLDAQSETMLMQVFRAGFLLCVAPSTQSRDFWLGTLAQAHVLRKRCPWMATDDYAVSIMNRQVTQFAPLLLVDLCT